MVSGIGPEEQWAARVMGVILGPPGASTSSKRTAKQDLVQLYTSAESGPLRGCQVPALNISWAWGGAGRSERAWGPGEGVWREEQEGLMRQRPFIPRKYLPAPALGLGGDHGAVTCSLLGWTMRQIRKKDGD